MVLLNHAFDHLWQARADRGIGLGLAIAESIVAADAGRIWAESTVGKGSTLFFAVPTLKTPTSDDGGKGKDDVTAAKFASHSDPAGDY